MTASRFELDGFAVVPDVLTEEECADAAGRVQIGVGAGGTRSLLRQPWCRALAAHLRAHPRLAHVIPEGHAAVQCTFFEKSADRNWLVAMHQDLSIPVAGRVDEPSLRGWSEKEGMLFVQAPVETLSQMLAVRVHLDPCGMQDGPLRVVPGSHVRGMLHEEAANEVRSADGEFQCLAEQGGVLLLRPLLLHASSKGTGAGRRRVLHFMFGPRELPYMVWRGTTSFDALASRT